ncbi:MAG: outer membrane beta-barrel protein [Myxococcales bacterium]|nr:outer membrane beta-barrel protein [Myxococcales bacterium]
MTRLTRLALLLPFAVALLVLPRPAEAQCNGTEIFCASVTIGGAPRVAPPPPRNAQIVIQTQPVPQRRVIIQAAPPPPPIVVVRAAPPPPPRQVILIRTQAPPPPPQRVVVRPLVVSTEQRIGIHGQIGAMMGPDVQMGGFAGALRLRPVPHLALDLGVGVYAGTDYNGLDRLEVPVTVDALLFVNPEHRMQFYLLAGVGVSRAHADGYSRSGFGGHVSRDYTHVGGEVGLGLEWRLNPHFALNTDLRAFLRTRVDSNPEPEFVNSTGTQTSDLSAGARFGFGGTVYF